MTIKFNKSEKFINAKKAFVASLTNSELKEEERERKLFLITCKLCRMM